MDRYPAFEERVDGAAYLAVERGQAREVSAIRRPRAAGEGERHRLNVCALGLARPAGWIVGSAMLTIVASKTTMNCATATGASTAFGLPRATGPGAEEAPSPTVDVPSFMSAFPPTSSS